MKPIVAQNQVSLGLAKCLRLTLSGMSYRLFRSTVTVSILALAVAFLVTIVSHGVYSFAIQVAAYDELSETRLMGELINRMGSVDRQRTIVDTLSRKQAFDAEAGELNRDALSGAQVELLGRIAEYQTWAGLPEDEFNTAQATALSVTTFEDWLQSLPAASQAVLLSDSEPDQLLRNLEDTAAFDAFMERVQSLTLVVEPVNERDALRELITTQRASMLAVVDRIQTGHRQATQAVAEALGNVPAEQALIDPPANLAELLSEQGYSLASDAVARLKAYAQQQADFMLMRAAFDRRTVRQAVARETGERIQDVSFDLAVSYITNQERATWFAETLNDAGIDALNADRVLELTLLKQRTDQLQGAIGDEQPEPGEGLFGLPERTQWLVALSFLVCAVGVANAMLMSVTERFTEIATMKCLGAMDGFVMMMFVIEAAIQGFVGGCIGLVLGVVLALLRVSVEYGGMLNMGTDSLMQVGLAMIVSLIVGMALAVVAAVGPSYVAASLAPMEAMRID